jgi:hypothetical protein
MHQGKGVAFLSKDFAAYAHACWRRLNIAQLINFGSASTQLIS